MTSRPTIKAIVIAMIVGMTWARKAQVWPVWVTLNAQLKTPPFHIRINWSYGHGNANPNTGTARNSGTKQAQRKGSGQSWMVSFCQ